MNFENTGELAKKLATFSNFADILRFVAKEHPKREFLVTENITWTYDQFDNLVDQSCRFLLECNVARGDVVSGILRNSVDFLVIYFSCIRLGVCFNPLPFHLHPAEVIERVNAIDAPFLFCHKEHYAQLSKLTSCRVINLDNLKGETLLEMLEGSTGESGAPQKPVKGQDTAILYYSSGTSGKPKLVEYTHESMVQTQANMVGDGYIDAFEKHLCVMPLGHTAALRHTIKPCICTASTVYLFKSFWEIKKDFWQIIEKREITYCNVVPTIIVAIMAMKYPNFHAKQIRSLKYLASSSSTLSRGLQKSFQERFGVSIANLYGCSEIGAAFFDNPREPGWAPGSIGRPFHGYRVVIKDSQRKEVTPGEVGEIGVAGVGVLKGYMNDAQSFAECMHGKYFMTGDLGYQDKAGRYFFVDRVKDIIIKAGINIAPAQIDEVLQSHPNVEESATIGASDHYLGEIVESYVVQKGAGVSALDLIRFCSGVLGSFKTPSKIVFTDALPKGPTGKILKRVLREESSKGLN